MALSRAIRTSSATLLALPLTRVAHASTLTLVPDCSVSGDSLNCHLQSFLHFLYVAAGALAFVLFLTAYMALRTYRQNKNEKIHLP
jgi:hypothetical protein